MGLTSFVLTIGTRGGQGVAPPELNAPVNVAVPVITYATGIYTASQGTWADAVSFAYQWKLDGVDIGGETGTTYEPIAADESSQLTVTVTATNTTGSTPATSVSVQIIFPIALSDGYIDMIYENILLDGGTPASQNESLYVPRLFYHEGESYFVYSRRDAVLPYSQAMMLAFHEDKGFDRPIIVGTVPGQADTHNIPAVAVDDNDVIWIVQENTHTTPIIRYKSLANKDYGYFSQEAAFGTTLSYPHLIKLASGNFICWSRATTEYEIYVTKAAAGFDSWGSQIQVSQRPLGNDPYLRHYPGIPWGTQKVGSTYYTIISCRKDDGILIGETWWYRFYVLTTEDFDTYTNLQGTYSRSISVDGVLTDAILNTNFKYYETATDETSAGSPTTAISPEGDFYAITGHSSGSGFVFHFFESGSYVHRDIDIADLDLEFAPTALPFKYITPYAPDNIHVIVSIDHGTYNKPHLFKTTDKGLTWIDLGDMNPDISDRTLRAMIPNNILEIPVNSNFPVYFGYPDPDDAQTAGLIARVAARGVIQSIAGESVTAAGTMNYNSTGLFHYICTTSQLTKTGNNVTGFINQFGLGNGTANNNPQWNGSDAVTFTAASSQKLAPANQATLCGKGALTFIIVTKFNTGVLAQLLSFANTANNNSRIGFNTLTANAAGTHPATIGMTFDKSTSDDPVTVYGQDDIDDGEFHVLAFTIDHRARPDMFIDGKLQYYQASSNTSTLSEWQSLAKGPSGLTTAPNTCNIAAIDRSSDVFTDLVFKEAVLFDGVLPYAELKSRIKKLCNDYSITYQNQYQIPV